MALVRVASRAELAPGQVKEHIHRGRRYAICNVDGELHAIDGACPHMGGPLAQGALHGSTVVCPWHAWEFDCRTGELDRNPAIKVKTLAVQQQDGDILLDLP